MVDLYKASQQYSSYLQTSFQNGQVRMHIDQHPSTWIVCKANQPENSTWIIIKSHLYVSIYIYIHMDRLKKLFNVILHGYCSKQIDIDWHEYGYSAHQCYSTWIKITRQIKSYTRMKKFTMHIKVWFKLDV